MLLNVAVKSIKRASHRGNQSITTDNITLDVIACINEAIRDVQKLLPKRNWYVSNGTALSITAGVAGTAAIYSLAATCQEASIFHYTLNSAYTVLTKIDSDSEWLTKVWSPTQTTGLPLYWREIGRDSSGYQQIEIFPIPNTSITLKYEYYKKKSADLIITDLNSEIPDIPDEYQDTLYKGGYYYFLKSFDDAAQAVAKSDYEGALGAYESGDERDTAGTLCLRLGTTVSQFFSGFRL